MRIIGTAGHIDHGKSTLVMALTGVDPDRLGEEKARGMTIDLGFAPLRLPSGKATSIIDVPGHERFIANMLAGAGGVDVALLIVAADEGVMPQTREHLAILDLLGVGAGVVAITKRDVVDAEWLDLVTEEVEELIAGTALEGSAVVPVSATTGQGLDDLRTVLDEILLLAPAREDVGVPRVPVDRVFTVAGFGTVVTGTLVGGTLALGAEAELMPSRVRTRVRAIQSHGEKLDRALPGTRVAINLAGIDRDAVGRGDVVAVPEALRPVRRIDAWIRVVSDSPLSLKSNAVVTVHAGAAATTARVFPLQTRELLPGDEGWVQLRLERPLAVWRRQRLVVRSPSPSFTLAGGIIADIAPRRRARADDTERLDALLSSDPERVVLALLESGMRDVQLLAMLAGLAMDDVAAALGRLRAQGSAEELDGRYVSAATANRLRARVLAAVAEYHALHPLRRLAPREEIRRMLRLSSRALTDLTAPLTIGGQPALYDESGGYAVPEHLAALEHADAAAAGASLVLEALAEHPLSPPSLSELLLKTGAHRDVVRLLSEEGKIVRVSESLYLTRAAYDTMLQRIVKLIEREGRVTVAQIRDALDTSRKYALAYAEHLDARRITRRVGDERALSSTFNVQRST